MLNAAWMMIAAQPAVVSPPAPPSPLEIADQIRPPMTPKQRAGSGPEMTNMAEVFSPDNYPFWAGANWEEGRLRFRVEVDAAGRAVACAIVEKALSDNLNQPTCDLVMARARFRAATDRRGRPVAGSLERKVRWQLEERYRWGTGDRHRRVILWVDAAGQRQCRIEASPGNPVDPRTCGEFVAAPGIIGMLATALYDRAGQRDRWELVIQDGQIAAGGPAGDGSTIGSRSGEQLGQRSRARLTIDAAGKVTGCKVLEKGAATDDEWRVACERHSKEQFEPSAAGTERTVVVVNAVFLRGR